MGYEMTDVHCHNHRQQQQQMGVHEEERPSQDYEYNFQQQNQIFQEICSQPTRQEHLLSYQNQLLAFLPQQQQDSNTVVPGFCSSRNFESDFNEYSRKIRFLGGVEEDGLAYGNDPGISGTRGGVLAASHHWQNQEDSAIRRFFWKPFSTDHSARANSRTDCETKNKEERLEMNQDQGCNYSAKTEEKSFLEEKSKLLGELEAICRDAAMSKNRAGASSSPSGENLALTNLPLNLEDQNHLNPNVDPVAVARLEHVDQDPVALIQDDRELSMVSKKRKKAEDSLDINTMAVSFENLVKQIMEHQEILHMKFMDILERLDKERIEREEAWKRQKLERLHQAAAARAHERALASSREATIIEYLERITGQKIELPLREPQLANPAEGHEGCSKNEKSRNLDDICIISKRWPEAEVEALMKIRGSLESKFQEPGLEGPLWEEISNAMASMGFHKNARRCREKWENINTCSKKAKGN